MKRHILFVMCFLCVKEKVMVVAIQKLINPKDLSEHCRRRVVPSVFLGKKTVEANAHILQFTRLELPYSCFISIKTESGSNIVLVVELLSETSVFNSCTKNGNQLSIYEMGETFGGYWGPIPDAFISPNTLGYTKYYTRKTTVQKVSKETSPFSDNDIDESTTLQSPTLHEQYEKKDDEDFIRMMLPLVNVSGRLVPGEVLSDKSFDVDEAFDYFYDVTPQSGKQYETSIMPLVQFSFRNDNGPRRNNLKEDSRYQLDYNIDIITPDNRLTFPSYSWSTTTKKKKPFRKYNSYANRRFRLKKNITRLFNNNINSQTRRRLPLSLTRNKMIKETFHKTKFTVRLKDNKDVTSEPKNFIDTFLNKYNFTLGISTTTSKYLDVNRNQSMLLRKYSKTHHNFSAHYLTSILNMDNNNDGILVNHYDLSSHTNPTITTLVKERNLSTYFNFNTVNKYGVQDDFTTDEKKLGITDSITELISGDGDQTLALESLTSSNIVSKEIHLTDINKNTSNTNVSPSTNHQTDDSRIAYNSYYTAGIEEHFIFTEGQYSEMQSNNKSQFINNSLSLNSHSIGVNSTHSVSEKIPKGSLVDRESWENVVQVAPVIAIILNQTTAHPGVNLTNQVFHAQTRNKRHVQAIPILNARPHKIPTTKELNTVTEFPFHISDMNEFAQLVELQDDEIHGRVALRYLRQYAGPNLFNVCDDQEVKLRQILLFNSSQIILAVTNFTTERMLIVATTARTLSSSEKKCPEYHLECQISGTRVCIDSTSACDGIPNCGSYDIYDEDRFLCGGVSGLQHNVYLATIIFFALLLTMLYTVHYWLKRCVPNVSEAFFVYNNGTENVLYLDSIMKSPMDVDDGSKVVYHGNIFDDDTYTYINEEKKNKNLFSKLKKTCLTFISFNNKQKYRDKRKQTIDDTSEQPRKTYSFAQLEIRKMIQRQCTDASIQTGESIEMAFQLRKREKESVYEKYNTQKSQEINEDLSPGTKDKLIQQKHEKELNVLKFIRDSKSGSNQTLSVNIVSKETSSGCGAVIGDERELQSTVYEEHAKDGRRAHVAVVTTCEVHEKPESSRQTRKQLRFDEEATTIPRSGVEDNDEININKLTNTNYEKRRSAVLGIGRSWRDRDVDIEAIDHDPEHSSSPARDFMRFWTSSKAKKPKKKTHHSPTLQ